MKPVIAKTMRAEARTMSWDLGVDTLGHAVRFWTEEVRHAKWLMKMNGGKHLAQLNVVRRRLIIAVMALEIRISRHRWSRPLGYDSP